MKTNNQQSQVGGNHYERLSIEPVHIFNKYNLNWFQGEAIKYPSRFPFKGGYKDLFKSSHILGMALNFKPHTIYDGNDFPEYNLGEEPLIEDYLRQFRDGFFREPHSWYIFQRFIYFVLNKEYCKAKNEIDLLIYSEYETFHFED